jgi:hypothetical protein
MAGTHSQGDPIFATKEMDKVETRAEPWARDIPRLGRLWDVTNNDSWNADLPCEWVSAVREPRPTRFR